MKIISNFSKDTQSIKPKPGSYEWWYFDACSEDGYTLVVIFYDGNPFSRKYIEQITKNNQSQASDFPAISISLYKNSQPIFYSFEEVAAVDAEFSKKIPKGKIGNNRFEASIKAESAQYQITLDQTVPNGDSIHAELSFSSLKQGLSEFPDENRSGKSDHVWNLLMPKCKVNGKVSVEGFHEAEFDFEGTGYHDHNTGLEPMKESFREWYWGRYHTNDATLIYYLMFENNEWDKKAWLISDDGEMIYLDDEIRLLSKGYSRFGLYSARSIQFAHGDTEAFLQLDNLIDNGPFYQRFGGSLLLNKNGTMYRAKGISEYIYPSRIYNRMFWPLVNMRIKYPGKAHWVQKSPKLYRWTW